MSNDHELFNGICRGCHAAVKQEDIDPDYLYTQVICGRCLKELETLPPRHQIVFTRLQKETKKALACAEHRAQTIAVLRGFIRAHGLNPDEADDSYMSNG